jgi:High-affinity K+ transport system, ATPase chain B
MVLVLDSQVIGAIEFNDIIKPWINERIKTMKTMNIKTVMCTGDNELTAEYISREAGLDEFVANSKPQDKYMKVEAKKISREWWPWLEMAQMMLRHLLWQMWDLL